MPLSRCDLKRWCPSYGKGWPDGRAVCPDCLVELVDHLAPFRPLAAVALVLAAKVRLGRTAPVPAPREAEEREGWRRFS